MTAPLVQVLCPVARPNRSGTRLCWRVLAEVPRSWGPIVIRELPDRSAHSGSAELRHCTGCGRWVEIRYEGLRAA
jgi:hypothetical protein